jgi:hypothetical protein
MRLNNSNDDYHCDESDDDDGHYDTMEMTMLPNELAGSDSDDDGEDLVFRK